MNDLGAKLLKFNLNKHKFLVIDTETESLSLTRSRCWEIAWSVYEGEKKLEEHQYYLKWPNLKLSEGAARATGFRQENVDNYGKDPKEVIDLLDKYLYNDEYKICGSNLLGFDVYILNTARNLLGYKTDYSYIKRIYDTISLARCYKLNMKIPENKDDFIPFQYRMLSSHQKGMNVKNSTMAKEFGILKQEQEHMLHQASFDIQLTFGVFRELVKKLDIE